MSSGKNPLVLMMALSMPGAANALGLGDIHVESGLNERLAAEIDIVGATALELADLRAAVADRETFLHYGADRPSFLSSATFKVTQDSQGRPQLAIRSTESFTEPVVNFLVDLRWHNGEMIRQYTLLLDPPGLAAASIPLNQAAAAPAVLAPAVSPPAIPAAPDVPAMPAAAAPSGETKAQTVSRPIDPPRDQPGSGIEPAARKTTHVKVGAKATLRGIAWRVGERSEPDLQRMMIAIFRANPSAFDGNINRMHRGAVLTIPSRTEAAAISKADAKREVHAQMAAWHSPTRAVASSSAAGASATTAAAPNVAASPTAASQAAASQADASQAAASPAAVSAIAATAPNSTTSPAAGQAPDSLAGAALGLRVQSLEHELTEMKGLLESERNQMVTLQRQATSVASQPALTEAPQAVAVPQGRPKSGSSVLVPVIGGLGILGAALAGLYFKFRRRVPTQRDSRIDGGIAAGETAAADGTAAFGAGVQDLALPAVKHDAPSGSQPDATADEPIAAPIAAQDDAQETDDTQEAMAYVDDATHPLLPVLPAAPAGRSEIAAAASVRAPAYEPTVNMHVDTVNLRADATRLDYNLLDLDLTAQHVQMPSVLNEHAVVKERRTNLADVLKLAIEREPDRHDLRMKLLELYYSAAATNRRAFLEVVQKLARDRDHLQGEQWDKIAYMGRQIAAENPLFAETSADDDDLADCA